MTYSQIINELTFDWLRSMKVFDRLQTNTTIEDIEAWYKHLDTRRELQNKLEDLVENSKLYKEKNGL